MSTPIRAVEDHVSVLSIRARIDALVAQLADLDRQAAAIRDERESPNASADAVEAAIRGEPPATNTPTRRERAAAVQAQKRVVETGIGVLRSRHVEAHHNLSLEYIERTRAQRLGNAREVYRAAVRLLRAAEARDEIRDSITAEGASAGLVEWVALDTRALRDAVDQVRNQMIRIFGVDPAELSNQKGE